MINPSSLRVAHTGAYRVRFPVSGRAFLGRDYNVALLQGLTLLEVATYFFRFNSFWHLSQKIYSHSIVVWQQHAWLVQCFVLETDETELNQVHSLTVERALTKLTKRFMLNQHAMRFKVKYDHLVDKRIDKFELVDHDDEYLVYDDLQPFRLYFERIHAQCQNVETYVEDDYGRGRKLPALEPEPEPEPSQKKNEYNDDEGCSDEENWVAPLSMRRWYTKAHDQRWDAFHYGPESYQLSSTYQYILHQDGRLAFDKRVTTEDCDICLEHTWLNDQVMHGKCQQVFARLTRLLEPSADQQAWFKRLSHQLNTEYQPVINNRVNFCWRLISSARHGNINLWLGLLALRVNQRGTYRSRAIVFPLMNWAEQQEITPAGVHVRCAGRFTRKQRADYEIYRFGQHTSPNNLTQAVDQVFFTFPLKFGAIGITLTVNY